MLAGPKRKQKISVDPRNKQWSEDTNRFGQRLMKQMGWSHGKGLGINEDGKTEHIKVTLKNDNRGLGCNQNVEDNWISHQDDFNDLLSNLHQEHNQETPTAKNSSNPVSSIEEKSKSAKRRVHYKKFTRGKDLASRSISDMNCILGRRSASGSNTPQSTSAPTSDHESEEEKPESYGVKTIVNTVSMQEYFAQKMARMKETNTNGIAKEGNSPGTIDGEEGESPVDEDGESQIYRGGEEEEGKRKKKKKKAKKRRKLEEGSEKTGEERRGIGDGMKEEGGVEQDVERTADLNGHEENGGFVENDTLDGINVENGDGNDVRRNGWEESGGCENSGGKLKRKKKKKKRKINEDED